MTTPHTLSKLFEALSHPHRRIVLYYLRDRDRASLDALAACVTGWLESGPDVDLGDEDVAADYDAVRVQLHHVHLPMLADGGFLAYDTADRTATAASLSPAVEAVLSTALEVDAGGDELDLDAFVASSGQ